MTYKQEINDYKAKALDVYQGHLVDLEQNIITLSTTQSEEKTAADFYIDYQNSTIKLIEGKIKIDNEFVKQINIKYLDKYKDLDPEQFEQLKLRVVDNHRTVISELKDQYEELAVESRENIKFKLAETREDNDLNIDVHDPVDFFPKKISLFNFSFVAMLVSMTMIIVILYLFILK
ncbi:hypothetical protein RZE82_02575 [Mollicutes bacterium LVI A0039]|nr:hypothetical protein RZE82_02575 [Mollicutes bacterium LVI A0039]